MLRSSAGARPEIHLRDPFAARCGRLCMWPWTAATRSRALVIPTRPGKVEFSVQHITPWSAWSKDC